ncbi:MAG: DUF2442 domain-containing protein [Clostridium sp.]
MDPNYYIQNVTALDNHHLHVQLCSGSSVTVDFMEIMNTVKFYRLKDENIFKDVHTDGIHIIWGDDVTSITAKELMDAALIG